MPEISSISGTAMRRGASQAATPIPSTAATATGVLTSRAKNSGTAAGISPSVRWRPSSSADELV